MRLSLLEITCISLDIRQPDYFLDLRDEPDTISPIVGLSWQNTLSTFSSSVMPSDTIVLKQSGGHTFHFPSLPFPCRGCPYDGAILLRFLLGLLEGANRIIECSSVFLNKSFNNDLGV